MRPSGQSLVERKYVDASLRGGAEDYLRVIRGRIDTTTSTILEGGGFTISRTAVGRVVVTFIRAFATVPSVVATPESDTVNQTHVCKVRTVSATSVTLQRNLGGVSDQDGIVTFLVVG